MARGEIPDGVFLKRRYGSPLSAWPLVDVINSPRSMVTSPNRIAGSTVSLPSLIKRSDKTITGRASFNVEPEQAALYFHKIQCFCFTEQTLKPGQEVDMPVVYYVDPKILDDPDNKDVDLITLSYTFHQSGGAAQAADNLAKALDRAKRGG